MKAITIKQPWVSLIVHGIKDIENRSWACPWKYIGHRVLIHASGKPVEMRNPNGVFSDWQKSLYEVFLPKQRSNPLPIIRTLFLSLFILQR